MQPSAAELPWEGGGSQCSQHALTSSHQISPTTRRSHHLALSNNHHALLAHGIVGQEASRHATAPAGKPPERRVAQSPHRSPHCALAVLSSRHPWREWLSPALPSLRRQPPCNDGSLHKLYTAGFGAVRQIQGKTHFHDISFPLCVIPPSRLLWTIARDQAWV
jgi:hypothetical protein